MRTFGYVCILHLTLRTLYNDVMYVALGNTLLLYMYVFVTDGGIRYSFVLELYLCCFVLFSSKNTIKILFRLKLGVKNM